MNNHTKEPWHTGGSFDAIVYDKSGNAICSAITHHGRHDIPPGENARRIVACVNACDGIDTEWLIANQKRVAPSGWAIVPVEPTSEMQDATTSNTCLAVWHAMLHAAPAQKPNLGPSASPLIDKVDGLTAERNMLLSVLERISKWSEHSSQFALDNGSNGVRDMYRAIAAEAVDKAKAMVDDLTAYQRIADCVNALEGIDSDNAIFMKGNSVRKVVVAAEKKRLVLEAERDTLLRVLKKVHQTPLDAWYSSGINVEVARAVEGLDAPPQPDAKAMAGFGLGTVEKQRDALLAALEKYEQAFEGMFLQCFSNGIKDAWGNPVDCTLLNHAHCAAGKAIRGVVDKAQPDADSWELRACREAARVVELEANLAVTEKLLAERQKLLDAIPECSAHGACIPHAVDWVSGIVAQRTEMLAALKGVVRVADRATVEFDAAREAIAKCEVPQ